MDSHEKRTTYFRTTGTQNTKALLSIVKEYVDKEEIENIIVATNTGETGAEVAKAFKGKNAVVITHCYGFQQPGKFELKDEFKRNIGEWSENSHYNSRIEQRGEGDSQKIRHAGTAGANC